MSGYFSSASPWALYPRLHAPLPKTTASTKAAAFDICEQGPYLESSLPSWVVKMACHVVILPVTEECENLQRL